MDHIPQTNSQKIVKSFADLTLRLVVLFGVAGLAAPSVSIAAPNTGGTQKTEKQCKTDRTTCEKACDQLIDVGDAIRRCKDLCTDGYLMCLPFRSGQPGSKLEGVRPSTLPRMNAPIMKRGVEGEQPDNSTVEPATGQPEQTNPTGEIK